MHQRRRHQPAARGPWRARGVAVLLRTDQIAVPGVSHSGAPSYLVAAPRCVVVGRSAPADAYLSDGGYPRNPPAPRRVPC